jgi:cell division protein FtsL
VPRATSPKPAYNRDATAPQLRPSSRPPRPLDRTRDGSRPTPLQVVEPAARRRSIGLLVAGICAVIFVGLLGLTAVQVTLAQNQQQLDQVNRDVQQARDYYDRLRLAVAKLQSPEYIVPAATKRLGMVPASSPQYLTPTAAVVDQVAAATGETISDAGSGAGAGRPDWGEVKRISGQLP